jgi:two-component sensor histidine kinase
LQDITERKKTEEALKESESRLNRAQRVAKTGSWEWDIKDNVVMWSDSLYQIYGVDKASFTPSVEGFMSLIYAEDGEAVGQYLSDALEKKTGLDFEHRVLRPVDQNVIHVHCLGELVLDADDQPLKMHGTSQDITEAYDLKKKLESSLKRKDVLLQEIHHRVKNNLQVISSLLNIKTQMATTLDKDHITSLFKPIQDRIQVLALVHESLYRLGPDCISFKSYVEELTGYLIQTYRLETTAVSLQCDIDESVFFDMDLTHYLGLIINELTANSLKYAFPHQENGHIKISLVDDAETYKLQIADTGVGLPENIVYQSASSFGFKLLQLLIKQIDATIHFSTKKGLCVDILFSKKIENIGDEDV